MKEKDNSGAIIETFAYVDTVVSILSFFRITVV
jgi:hypothetical protein